MSSRDVDCPLVTIRCTVFNHENYLRQCLDGFVNQRTDFRFEAFVHDDASTDGSKSIIEEYAARFPDIIKPLYESENLFSKHDGSFRRATYDSKVLKGKYIALCEGDDFWTDPHKLQKQVDFLESHPDYTMVCSRATLFSSRKGQYVGENYCQEKDGTLAIKDIVNRSGLFIPTCTIVFRKSLLDNYPDYCKRCVVGDYPLQIYAAMNGKVYYFNDIMATYRVENQGSWMGSQGWKTASDNNLKRVESMIKMFDGFAGDYPQYSRLLRSKIAQYLRDQMPCPMYDYDGFRKYTDRFKVYLKEESLLWKLDYWLRGTRLPVLRHYYFHSEFLVRKYRKRVSLY